MGSHNFINNVSSVFFIVALLLILTMFFPMQSFAAIGGVCSNCHTMHNSQNGAGAGSGSGPNKYLMLGLSGYSDPCVGCHSSSVANETKKNLNGSIVPIVLNTVAPSAPVANNMLAGGNFYWVSKDSVSWDKYGHNVYGIVGTDRNLVEAPGTLDGCGAGECHTTLSSATNSRNKPGCQGCHFRVMHHVIDSSPVNSNTGYRFLWGHTFSGGNYTAWVEGVEDSDWEATKSSADHNFYKGTSTAYLAGANGLANSKSISAFCSGCHGVFHNENGGPTSPWTRHPIDIALPTTGEYNSYDPTTSYSTEAPVSWQNPTAPVRSEARVMCMSCHRPHGSDQPDMLRWDYNTMVAGGGGSGGCFSCHTTKD